MLKGNLDVVNLREVVGWAQEDTQPDVPVSLLVIDNDQLLGRVLANRYRADLEAAGIGDGRHSFEFRFPKGLVPFESHVLRLRRESDGADLAQSPVTIEPTEAFDDAIQTTLAEVIRRCGSEADAEAKIDFLIRQVDGLLQQLADRDSRRAERSHYRQLLHRWRRSPADSKIGVAGADPPPTHPRALVIDDRMPRSDRDAGSVAILSHITSLQRLGYEVAFAPAAELAAADSEYAALQAIGVTPVRAPYYGSIEELLRRQAGEFDLVYLHRVANAMRYGELVRHHNPRAWRIFSVADLHHVRLARQASAEDRPELVARSRWMQFAEYVAAVSANAVITHSAREAEALAKQIPRAKIHIVPWSVTPRPTKIPFRERRGVAFIGGYGHEPNLDAARWLIDEIMPLARKRNPDLECFLVGSDMPEQIKRLCGDGVSAVGHVGDLAEVFDRVRLTVAPLSYGAGIKGKVIESLAAGVPCVCTPVAAEGLDLPPELQACVAESADRLAGLICDLHDNPTISDGCARAGLSYVSAAFSTDAVDAAMHRAAGPAAPPRRAASMARP